MPVHVKIERGIDLLIESHKMCSEHSFAVPDDYIIALAYETKSEIFQWMVDTQLGRRNLTPIQKIAIAEKYRPIYEAKAKENMTIGINQYSPLVNLPNPSINTSEELSKIAGVSEKTYRMGATIINSDNDTLKQEVISGQKSINAGYNELTGT